MAWEEGFRVTSRKALLFAVDPVSRFAANVGKQRSDCSHPTRAKQFARFLLSAKVKPILTDGSYFGSLVR